MFSLLYCEEGALHKRGDYIRSVSIYVQVVQILVYIQLFLHGLLFSSLHVCHVAVSMPKLQNVCFSLSKYANLEGMSHETEKG